MNGFLFRILLLVIVFVSAAVMIERDRSKRYRTEFQARLESLVAEGFLTKRNAFSPTDPIAEPAAVQTCADELEVRVRAVTASPIGDAQVLTDRRVQVEQKLDELLALPECATRLESGGRAPLKSRPDLGAPLREILWGGAFQDAAKRNDPTGAAFRFARYLDVLYLSEAYREREYEWHLDETLLWLDAFAQLVSDPAFDAPAVFAALDARLERAAAAEWYVDALVGEFGRNFRPDWIASSPLDADFERVWHQIGALDAVLPCIQGPCLDPSLPPRRNGRLNLPYDYGPTHEYTDMERRSHQARRSLTLARVALALLVEKRSHGAFPSSLEDLDPHFAAGVPQDPCVRAPFAYRVTSADVELTVARWPRPADPTHQQNAGWTFQWSFPVTR